MAPSTVTEEQLIKVFLRPYCNGVSFSEIMTAAAEEIDVQVFPPVRDKNVYGNEDPWILLDGDKEAFFLTPRPVVMNKNGGGARGGTVSRFAGSGFWKNEHSHKNHLVVDQRSGEVIGEMTSFSFRLNSDRNKSSGWVMHEYLLHHQNAGFNLDRHALCRIALSRKASSATSCHAPAAPALDLGKNVEGCCTPKPPGRKRKRNQAAVDHKGLSSTAISTTAVDQDGSCTDDFDDTLCHGKKTRFQASVDLSTSNAAASATDDLSNSSDHLPSEEEEVLRLQYRNIDQFWANVSNVCSISSRDWEGNKMQSTGSSFTDPDPFASHVCSDQEAYEQQQQVAPSSVHDQMICCPTLQQQEYHCSSSLAMDSYAFYLTVDEQLTGSEQTAITQDDQCCGHLISFLSTRCSISCEDDLPPLDELLAGTELQRTTIQDDHSYSHLSGSASTSCSIIDADDLPQLDDYPWESDFDDQFSVIGDEFLAKDQCCNDPSSCTLSSVPVSKKDSEQKAMYDYQCGHLSISISGEQEDLMLQERDIDVPESEKEFLIH